MKYTEWKRDGDTVTLVSDSNDTLAVVPRVLPGTPTSEPVLDKEWAIHATGNELVATLPDKRVFVAHVAGKKFGTASTIDITTDREIVAINESKANWIYETHDEQQRKLAQFSGGNNGVRRAITEFEPDNSLTAEEQVFLSFVTRKTLEEKLSSSSLVLICSLLLLTPLILLMAL